MKTKIAIATVDGRAYYKLVNELQRKKLPFLSLKPWDLVPFDIKTVITTKEESKHISHPKILLFEEGSNPEFVVDEALLVAQDKQSYQKIVIGVDPGNSCGVAIIGDNKILETLTALNIENAAHLIIDSLKRFQQILD